MSKNLIILVYSITFSLFSSEESKEKNRADYLPNNISNQSINNFSNVIDQAYLNTSLSEALAVLDELKKDVKDNKIIRIINIVIELLKTKEIAAIKKVITFLNNTKKIVKDITVLEKINELYSILHNAIGFQFNNDVSALCLSYVKPFEKIASLNGHYGRIFSVKWSQDSNKLITASHDNIIKTWDIESGNIIDSKYFNFSSQDNISPDLKNYAYTNNVLGPYCVVRSYLDQKIEAVKFNEINVISHVCWAQNNKQLAIIFNKRIIILNIKFNNTFIDKKQFMWKYYFSKLTKLRLDLQNLDFIKEVIWSPDSKFIASISYFGCVQLWNIDKKTSILLNEDSGYSLSWSPDGKYIALNLMTGITKILDSNTHLEQIKFTDGLVTKLCWSTDCKLLATISGKTLSIWDIQTGQKIDEIIYHRSITSITWSPCSKYFAINGNNDKTIDIYVRTIR